MQWTQRLRNWTVIVVFPILNKKRLLLCGCFSYAKIWDLRKIEATFGKKIQILQNNAVTSSKRLICHNCVCINDNNPKYTATLCRDNLNDLQQRKSLQLMRWSPQSLVINIIELLWDELDRRIGKTCHHPQQISGIIWENSAPISDSFGKPST